MKNVTLGFCMVCLLTIGLANVAYAGQLSLEQPTANFSQSGTWYNVGWTNDGTTQGSGAWGNYNPSTWPDTNTGIAVWETSLDANFNEYTFKLYFNTIAGGFNYQKTKISYTTDDRALFADGLHNGGDVDTDTWTVLPVDSAVSSNTAVATINGDNTIDWTANASTGVYTIVTSAPGLALQSITGFRLDALEVNYPSGNANSATPHVEVGWSQSGSSGGDGLMTEFEVYGAGQVQFLLGDANFDGVVSADDFAAVQANFGNHLPEPATIGLLAMGLIAVFCRRSK